VDVSEAGTYAHMFAGESKTGTRPIFLGGGEGLVWMFQKQAHMHICLQGRAKLVLGLSFWEGVRDLCG